MVRGLVYSAREFLVFGLAKDTRLLAPLAWIGKRHLIRQVPDRELRRKLIPRYSPGCKRLLLSNDYYPALTKPNVDVITDGIAEIRPGSIVTDDGAEHEVDTIIFATGFLVTDNPVMERVRGADGRSLAKAWLDNGSRAYLGTTVPGFPNLFMMTGPNTGIGHTSLLVMIEAQIRYVMGCLKMMSQRGIATVEVTESAIEAFSAELQERSKRTVWMAGGCQSWYLDAEGRNTTLWPDFTWRFLMRTRRFDPEKYILVPAGSQPREASA
jgi:cation diffusion facilitator CzcD-associated flavoprotein CzcO